MVVIRKKKSKKQRGSRTCGWGAGKKHRGKGHRGGHGASNVGKRGGARKTRFLALGLAPYGKKDERKGMTKKFKVHRNVINIFNLALNLNQWASKGLIVEKKGTYDIDLVKLGYDKLLAKGNISAKLNIKVFECSEKARQKIESAGGTVVSEKTEESPEEPNEE